MHKRFRTVAPVRGSSYVVGGLTANSEQPTIDSEAVKSWLLSLSYHQLVTVSKLVWQIRRSKFKDSKTRKYGNLNKGFTEEELQLFFWRVSVWGVSLDFAGSAIAFPDSVESDSMLHISAVKGPTFSNAFNADFEIIYALGTEERHEIVQCQGAIKQEW